MKRTLLMAMMGVTMSTALAQGTLREMSIENDGVDFSLWSPMAEKAQVNIYSSGCGGKPIATLPMERRNDGRWGVKGEAECEGRFYTFQIRHNGKWLDETPGIFATAVGVNGQRAAAIDIGKCTPKGWENDRAPRMDDASDVQIYEIHLRDFSAHANSGCAVPGKYLALTQKEKLDHLRRIGVTHVHLQPSFDYASVDESRPDEPQYNWGYDPLNYNVPEGSYSTDAADPSARVMEFRQMVMAMHKAGLRVVMDVVYNHVMDAASSPFERTAPGYFFRCRADGTLGNASGCGNETASEKELMRRYMVESTLYWAKEYHVDGFRFDLMGIHDIETMNLIRKALNEVDPTIIIYGEGWAAETPLIDSEKQAMKANMAKMPGIAAFGDELRDGVRGPWNDDRTGAFLVGVKGNEESIKMGLVGAINHPQVNYKRVNYSKAPWAAEPTQMVCYVSCHDDLNLADRIRITAPEANDDEQQRLGKLAFSIVMSSQGIPFMNNGDELLRDRKGVHNCFKSPDSVNAIDWSLEQKNAVFLDYVSRFARMRHSHKAFHMGSADRVRHGMKFIATKNGLIAFTLDGASVGDEWKEIVVVINGSDKQQSVAVKKGRYTVVCADGRIDEAGLSHVSGTKVNVARKSVTIMYKQQ